MSIILIYKHIQINTYRNFGKSQNCCHKPFLIFTNSVEKGGKFRIYNYTIQHMTKEVVLVR